MNMKYSTVRSHRFLEALEAAVCLSSQPCSNKTFAFDFLSHDADLFFWKHLRSDHKEATLTGFAPTECLSNIKNPTTICHVKEKRKLSVWGQRKGLLWEYFCLPRTGGVFCFKTLGTTPSGESKIWCSPKSLSDKANDEYLFLFKTLILSIYRTLLNISTELMQRAFDRLVWLFLFFWWPNWKWANL